MAKIIYRAASLDDVPQLVDLRLLMQCEVNEVQPSRVSPEFAPASARYFAEALKEKSYFGAVAEFEGRLVSANGLVLYIKPPSLRGLSGIVGYVANVYTRPEFRGRGIAARLMNMLVQYAKEANVSKLHLGATPSGKGLYEKAGFKPVAFEAMELIL